MYTNLLLGVIIFYKVEIAAIIISDALTHICDAHSSVNRGDIEWRHNFFLLQEERKGFR